MLVFIRGDMPSFGFAFGVFNRDASIPQVDAQWVDLSRFRAAPSARLGHLPFESDRAFPTQC